MADLAEPAHEARQRDPGHPVGEQEVQVFLLQQALRANLFLSAYESESGLRYRIHPLLREMLTKIDADAQKVAAIRRRAAAWLADHNGVDQALTLLLPAHPDDAAELLARGPLRAALLDFDLTSARRWLAQLPAESIDARPQLAVDAAWLILFAEESGLDQCADRALAALNAFQNDDGFAELRAEAALLHAFAEFLTGHVGAASTAADAALQLPCAEFGLAAGYHRLLTVILRNPSQSTDTNLRTLRDAEAIFRRIRFAHGALDSVGLRAIYAQRIGDAAGACAAFENALSILQFFGRENSYAAIDLHFFYGDHLYSLNRLTEARAHLERALAISAHSHLHTPSIYHAEICLQLCDLAAGALSAPFDAEKDARAWNEILNSNVIANSARIAWMRLVRDCRMNAPERCRRTFDSFGVSPAEHASPSGLRLALDLASAGACGAIVMLRRCQRSRSGSAVPA